MCDRSFFYTKVVQYMVYNIYYFKKLELIIHALCNNFEIDYLNTIITNSRILSAFRFERASE